MQQPDQQNCPLCLSVCALPGVVCPQCSAKLRKQFPVPKQPAQIEASHIQPGSNTPFSMEAVKNGVNPFSEQATNGSETAGPVELETLQAYTGGGDPSDPYLSTVAGGSQSGGVRSLGSLGIICMIGWIVLCIYFLVAIPGVGIALLVLSIPPLIRTTMVVARRQQFDKQVGNAGRVGLFLGSLLTFAVMVCVIGVSVLVGMYAGCIAAGQNIGGIRNIDQGMMLGACIGLLLSVIPLGFVVVSRWKRDVNR